MLFDLCHLTMKLMKVNAVFFSSLSADFEKVENNMDFVTSVVIVVCVVFLLHYFFGPKKASPLSRMNQQSHTDNSLLQMYHVR